jgi:hypothetical protein
MAVILVVLNVAAPASRTRPTIPETGRLAPRSPICLDGNMGSRAPNPMPADVRDRLIEADVMDAYRERPRYQRNDYLGWIARAKRRATRERRVQQMLDELRAGGVYMKMEHTPSAH